MFMATRKRHSPEQIVRKLTAADRLLAEGKDTTAVCRELGGGCRSGTDANATAPPPRHRKVSACTDAR